MHRMKCVCLTVNGGMKTKTAANKEKYIREFGKSSFVILILTYKCYYINIQSVNRCALVKTPKQSTNRLSMLWWISRAVSKPCIRL